MDRDIDSRTVTVLATGTFANTGGAYQIVQLTPEHIGQMQALQDNVQAALPEDSKGFLLPRAREDFEASFANGDSIIGILHQGRLIAQGAMVLPTAKNPATGIDVKLNVPPERIMILQGMMVEPVYRGHHLMEIMKNAQLNLAKQLGRIHVLAAIDVRNRASYIIALASGFEIHTISRKVLKQDIKTTVYGLYAPLDRLIRRDFNQAAAAKKAERLVGLDDIPLQEQLLQEGYKGIGYSSAAKSIGFQKK
jgi:hypothetical protein